MPDENKNVSHIVAWNFKPEISDAERAVAAKEIKSGLEGLVQKIPGLLKAKVYSEKTGGGVRDMMLVTLLENSSELSVYREHPEHKKVQQTVHKYMTDRICLDFFA